MRRLAPWLMLVAVLAATALVFLPPPSAQALTFPALPDAGGIVTSIDGGNQTTIDTGQTQNWTMTIRCEGAQSTRYRMCTSATCDVSLANDLIDPNVTLEIPVTQGNSQKYRYLTIKQDDGGVPYCVIQTSTPPAWAQ